jgi:hypothetical protein
MALLLALAACQPSAPKPPPAAPGEAAPVAPAPPVPLKWSFTQSADTCHARAAGGSVRLDITVSGHDPVELKLAGLPGLADRAGRRVAWVFGGSAGHWRLLSAARASHDLVAYIAPGERSASRILALLNGGMLTLGEARPARHRLRLPAANAAGQTWFDCVRRQR